jgi:flagellar biosynthetic protein FliR
VTDLGLGAWQPGVLVLATGRFAGLLAWAPGLGHASVPALHRGALAALLAVVVTPALPAGVPGSGHPAAWLVALAGEVLLGLAIGLVAQLALGAAQAAGQLVSVQMGLDLGAAVQGDADAAPGGLTRLFHLVALTLFLTLDGHHVLIRAAAGSFRRIAPGAALDPAPAGGLAALAGQLFAAALELAAPLAAALLLLQVALGLLSRVAPQANVLFVGLPASLGLGLLGLVDALPRMAAGLAGLVGRLAGDLDRLLLGFAHGGR